MGKKPVLVIMAAGMGSRYGGLKQIDPIDPWGNIIMDYSIYDAKQAGFEKVVFLIKKEIEEAFDEIIGSRIKKYMDVAYAYQELDKIPEGFAVPDGRTKPWGTAHAVLCCKDQIDGPFAVINADDYYGREAFSLIYNQLASAQDNDRYQYAMVGYELGKTLTENGSVARGVCSLDKDGYLSHIEERTRIEHRGTSIASVGLYGEHPGRTGKWILRLSHQGPCGKSVKMRILPSLCGGRSLKSRKSPGNRLKDPGPVVRRNLQGRQGSRCKGHGGQKGCRRLSGKTVGGVKTMKKEITNEILMEAAASFATQGEVKSCERYGNGHINDTFLLTCDRRYILQRMNTEVFQNPQALMENIEGVTSYLRQSVIKNGGDPDREALTLVRAKDGKSFYVDSQGGYWRVYLFIENATGYDQVKNPDDFYQSGCSFGRFQGLLAGYPADKLWETIPDFHNTPKRFETFKKAVEEDVCGRAANVQEEIAFVMDRAEKMGTAQRMLSQGELPLRVTHNDTKLNNILIDDATGKGLCVIDLDTVMPGLSIFDYGDSIRFGANTAAEDEPDASKASLSLPLFEAYTKGFLEGCGKDLTENEIRMLPWGAYLMTLECGTRFLTDYLQGDTYFHVAREGHNLDRCRTQFALVKDMEKKWGQMEDIVAHCMKI